MRSLFRQRLAVVPSRQFSFGGCPFPPTAAPAGLLLTGAPGSGKTVFKNQCTDSILLDIAERRAESAWRRALLYAHKPREVLRHLRALGIPREELAIFHPGRLDCRPLAESLDYAGEDGVFDLAKQLVPENPRTSEPFWERACATVVDGVGNVFLRRARGPWYSDDLLYAVSDPQRLKWVLSHWEGNSALLESFFGPEVERTRQSVLFTLETHAKTLRVSAKQLKAARARGAAPFSFVRDWMLGAGPRIVVVCHATTYAKSWGLTYVPFIISTAIRAFKEHTDHTQARPSLTLFDFDEFVQFRMNEPAEFFATVRELGGVPLVAVQSEPLLHAVYGEDLGRGILSNLSFQAHGTTNDAETAESASAQFGTHELVRRPLNASGKEIFTEARVSPDALLQENEAGKLRFFCRAPGVGKWRYEIALRDVARVPPEVARELEAEEDRMRAPSDDIVPWGEADLRRLGLSNPHADRAAWPAFLDPNADWRRA
ncbi:MAG: type IV secretion system DNA-binding domain-containing protein [Candidatus Eisenbacteria bacterium]|nr:type IV secretion system DNA-binding domain-containing protein [Candidatus Eisenbacteria bacterium]